MANTPTQHKINREQLVELKDLIKGLKKNSNVRLSRIQQNLVKKSGYFTEDIFGSWNGYGYEKLGKKVFLKEDEKIEDVINSLKEFLKLSKKTKIAKQRIPKTQKEKINSWAKKLSKLTLISLEQALDIAQEKLEYKSDRIAEMEDKQAGRYSVQRSKLIAKMERENPLRPIKDLDHAQAILSASRRHKQSNYEYQLDHARELADIGELDRSEVKEFARQNMQFANA